LGGRFFNGSGAWRGEVANVCLAVIARSVATKQSILSLRGKMDCFAALAMTARAMDCFAEPVIGRAFARPVGGYDASGEAARRRHWAQLVRHRLTSDAEATRQSSNRHIFPCWIAWRNSH